jgi:hypothetical protein
VAQSFLQILHALFLSVVFVWCLGCSTSAERAYRSSIAERNHEFTELEVRSRTWTDPKKGLMSLVVFQTLNTRFGPTIVLAQFGSSKTQEAFVLEIYERDENVLGEQTVLRLLRRDVRRSRIERIEYEEQNGNVFINLRRIYSNHAGNVVHNWYSYQYSPSKGITETMSDFYSEERKDLTEK